MRKQRADALRVMEEIEQQQWDTFIMNSEMMRGYDGN